ncbi:MAG: hypothetical protein AAGA23_21390 [Pseudomonadota bacterium]
MAELDNRLTAFFAEYADPKYDLWEGGTAKGSVARPATFRKLYGENWRTVSEPLAPFVEPPRR